MIEKSKYLSTSNSIFFTPVPILIAHEHRKETFTVLKTIREVQISLPIPLPLPQSTFSQSDVPDMPD